MGSEPQPVMPSFVCVGIEKCGTTSLHRMLDQHPDVYLGRYKEHFFFNREFERGVDWYLDRYSTYSGQRLVGDITPSYFRNPKSYGRINDLCGPETKGILVLREPLIRAWSHYNHQLLRAKFAVPFTETFDHPLINVDYPETVRRFQQHFGDRGLVLVYEDDIAANPLVAATAVGSHLGITIDHVEARWSNRGLAPHYVELQPGDLVDTNDGPLLIDTAALVFASRPELSVVTPEPTDQDVAAARKQQASWTRSLGADEAAELRDRVFGNVVDEVEQLLGRSLESWRHADVSPPYELAPLPVAKVVDSGVAHAAVS